MHQYEGEEEEERYALYRATAGRRISMTVREVRGETGRMIAAPGRQKHESP
jgi:hypothetical protein